MEEHKSAPKTAALADGTIGTPKRIAELKEAAGKPGRKQMVALKKLALSHYEGCGVDKDYKEAASYFKKAAELGDTLSTIQLPKLTMVGSAIIVRSSVGLTSLRFPQLVNCAFAFLNSVRCF